MALVLLLTTGVLAGLIRRFHPQPRGGPAGDSASQPRLLEERLLKVDQGQ